MSKPGKQRPRPPQTEKPQAPFWLGAVRNKRTRRLTDMTPLRKGGWSV